MTTDGAAPGGTASGGGCRYRHLLKPSHYFPEESFQSWGNYVQAMKETRVRLKDRLLARSLDSTELHEIRARSQNEMKRSLTWWDILWFGLGAVVGAGIFVLTGMEAKTAAGPAVVVSYLISGVCAMLAVLCYTEFAVEIPVAGGSFAYLRVELGDFMAFIAAGNVILEYLVSSAAVARAWTSYFATLINHHPDDLRITVSFLSADYSHLDPFAVLIIAVMGTAAIFSTKASSRFNYVTSILHVLVILFVIAAGLTHARPANLSPFVPFGIHGVFKAAAVLFFAYVGFDAVATMAEETQNPGRDIPLGLIGSMSVITVLYCAMALTISLMQPYTAIDPDAPFPVAFEAAGLGWAKYVVSLGALKGMTTVLLAAAVGQARYVTHIARAHMLPPCLAVVNPTTRTPIAATVVMMVGTSVIAFFTNLEILSNLLSIATLFIFSLVAVALLVRRYYIAGQTPAQQRNKMVGFLAVIIVSAVALAAGWALNVGSWVYYGVIVLVWFLGTLGMRLMLKKERAPKLWGTPLVPWLPAASIAVNVFLLGSIDAASYVRFLVWTTLLLVYYFLIGLHAAYDSARVSPQGSEEKTLEEGRAAVTEETQ